MIRKRVTVAWSIIVLSIAVNTCATLSGCGSGTSESERVAEAPAIPPQFATAETLIEHFNELNADKRPRIHEELALYHAENDLQRDILTYLRGNLAMADFVHALQQQFGTRLDLYDAYTAERATLIESSDRRAKARAEGNDGENRELHLVQIADRWWISGYTLEYDPPEKPEFVTWDELSDSAESLIALTPAMVNRVRAGEFESSDEAFQEFRRLTADRNSAP